MALPTDRKYSETHEWYLIEGDVVTLGITQHAADELTDITFVELPEVGKTYHAGDVIGEVESVKATSEIFTALPGTVLDVNTALAEHPERVNEDAFEEGWMVKLRASSLEPASNLMDAKEYKAYVRNAR
ncbi:MAG: glycine cleavage system protein GcvH [Planctomycetes bacterium]|nr:glycine cleavage system protein GcvH [Planctomycetota bacterium]